MQFIITEHPTWSVNVCIFKDMMSTNLDGCLINHLCNKEEIKHFYNALSSTNQEEMISSWILWIEEGGARD